MTGVSPLRANTLANWKLFTPKPSKLAQNGTSFFWPKTLNNGDAQEQTTLNHHCSLIKVGKDCRQAEELKLVDEASWFLLAHQCQYSAIICSGALLVNSRVLRPSLVTLGWHKSGRCAIELYHAPHLWHPPSTPLPWLPVLSNIELPALQKSLPLLTSWWRKLSNTTVGQSSLIYSTHHCYDWHRGSYCGCLTLSNTVLWRSWMVAYPGYTLQMKMMFPGWPINNNNNNNNDLYYRG